MGSQGLVSGLGHLIGGVEIGAIAQAFGISLAIGINAGAGLLLMLPVVLLTPLVWRPVESYYNTASVDAATAGLRTDQRPGQAG